jgi:TonB family protein
MFDFAISRNQRQRPTGRSFASWIVSCFVHFLFLLLLIEYPQLLRGGMYHHFHAPALLSNILGPKPDTDDNNWRTVAIVKDPSKMIAPSAATLRKYLYDWNKKGPGTPPVRIGWGDVKTALLESTPPMPRVRKGAKEPEISLPANDIVSAGSAAGSQPGNASGSSAVTQIEPTAKKNGTISLPPPGPAPKSEVAGNAAPNKVPDSTKTPPDAALPASGQKNQSSVTAKVFENEQKAIRSPDSGFFDTKGFPLGEYASLIIERIKGKWFIPSNLRNSQGHTTVIFYIDREGRFTNARIVESSGSNSLNLAALNAILESNPAPPLPKGFPGDHVGAKFVFSYNEPQ